MYLYYSAEYQQNSTYHTLLGHWLALMIVLICVLKFKAWL